LKAAYSSWIVLLGAGLGIGVLSEIVNAGGARARVASGEKSF